MEEIADPFSGEKRGLASLEKWGEKKRKEMK